MSVNKYKDHIHVLPEDDANRALAIGFLLEFDRYQVHILPEAGGWHRVCSEFLNVHVAEMLKYEHRRMVLLLDLDGHLDRPNQIKEQVPQGLWDRVFVFGVMSEPEALKADVQKSCEKIGQELARDCPSELGLWTHTLLIHNLGELSRMKAAIGPALMG